MLQLIGAKVLSDYLRSTMYSRSHYVIIGERAHHLESETPPQVLLQVPIGKDRFEAGAGKVNRKASTESVRSRGLKGRV